jgi:hypothetical protein
MTMYDGEMMYPAMAGYKTPYQRRQEAKARKKARRLEMGLHLPKRLRGK